MFDKDYKDSQEQRENAKKKLQERLQEKLKQQIPKSENNSHFSEEILELQKQLDKKDKIIEQLKNEKSEKYDEKSKREKKVEKAFVEIQMEKKQLEQENARLMAENKGLQQEIEYHKNSFNMDEKVEKNLRFFLTQSIQEETGKFFPRFLDKSNEILQKQQRQEEMALAGVSNQISTLSHSIKNHEHSVDEQFKQVFEKIQNVQEATLLKGISKVDSLEKERDLLKEKVAELTEKLADYQKENWLDVQDFHPNVLLSWLMQSCTPKNAQEFSNLVLLVERYNQVYVEAKQLDIWEEKVGTIEEKPEAYYFVLDGEKLKVTDTNGFIAFSDTCTVKALVQKYSKQVKIIACVEAESLVPLKKKPLKKLVRKVRKVSEEELKNKKELKKVLKRKRILLVSWHNMSSYVKMFQLYGAKVKVLDAKKNDNQIIPALFSEKYDMKYLFVNGVHHPTYWAAMKRYKSAKEPPESVRLTFCLNPEEVLHDSYLTLIGKQKESPLSMLVKEFKKN